MKIFRSLLLCTFFLLATGSACGGPSCTKFLSHFDEVSDDNLVLVGTVKSVKNSVLYFPNGNPVNFPEISFEVVKSLHGMSSQTETLYGFNSFYQRQDGSWAAKVSPVAPWILEKDKLLCLVKRIEVNDESGNPMTINKIKIVRFLDNDTQFEDSSILMNRLSFKIDQEQWKSNKFTEIPERIWGCVSLSVEEDTGLKLCDVANRLLFRQGVAR